MHQDQCVVRNCSLTSYWLNPKGTNSGALAESFDDLIMESTSLPPLEADVLL